MFAVRDLRKTKILRSLLSSKKYLAVPLLTLASTASIILGAVFIFTRNAYGAGSVMLIDAIQSQASQALNVPWTTRNVSFSYSGGGVVTFTSCQFQACTWAIDDAAQLVVTRPDGSTMSRDFISDTKDKPAQNIADMFQVGTNSVTINMIDRALPLRGLPRPLYIIESTAILPGPSLTVRSLPTNKRFNNNPYGASSKDPVNTLTGSYLYTHTDIDLKGRGPAPQFVRSYDSSDSFAGTMGPGWTNNYAMQLVRPDDTTSDIVLINANGRADRFTFNSGNYTAPAGIYTTLAKNSDGTYAVTQLDQTTWSFDELGRLTRITDRYGNQSVLSYDSASRLISVSDPAARGTLRFNYDGGGRLASVIDWAERGVRFGYDVTGRLSTVTDRENQVTTYNYDGTSSRIASIKDARNNIAVTNIYDTQGRVATQKDAKGLITGQQTTFVYTTNTDGTKTTVVTYPKTSADSTWSYVEEDTYDTQGRITKRISKPTALSTDWVTQQYGYDSAGNRSSSQDGRGNTTLYCYDLSYTGTAIAGSRGNLTRTIAPAPTNGGNVAITLQSYDSKNNLLQRIVPKGVASTASTNCSTNLSAAINANYATDFGYDSTQTRLVSSTSHYTDPDIGAKTAITKYEYNDPANPGMVTKTITPRGNTGASPNYAYATTNRYYTNSTNAGLLAFTTTAAGSTTSLYYDAVGRVTSMIDAKGNDASGAPADHTWQYTYDNEDRPLMTKSPAPQPGQSQLVTENRYDAVGNKTVAIDANGQVTKYLYDERDSLQEVQQTPNTWTDPSSTPSGLILTDYQYDNLGNMSRIIRAKGTAGQERVTDYKYDGLGRQVSETQYPNWPTTTPNLVTSYTYDKNGNKLSLKDANGKTTAYVYDNLNRQTNINYGSSVTPNVTYAYDLNGNRTSMADPTNGTTTYSYDELNRMLSAVNPGAKTVGYRYDLDNNRTKFIYPDNSAVAYSFDTADRMASLTDWANRTTSYSYNPDNSVKAISFFNSTSNNFAYDNANRLTQVWNKETANGANNTITQHNYTLDANGNRTRADEVLEDGDWNASPITADRQSNVVNTYDRMNRLTKEVRNMQTPQDDETLNYTYDPTGNRLSEWVTAFGITDKTNYTYDKADRILTTTGASSETFVNDANGNITSRGDPFAYTMTYDQANRMILSDTKQHKYFYDGDGNRVKTQEAGSWGSYSTKDAYLYDTNRDLPAMIQDNTHKYVWGLGLLYNESYNFAEQPGVYHFDGNGSMVSASAYPGPGQQPRLHTYEAYRDYGVRGYSNRSYAQPFKYTGEVEDEDFENADYMYLRSRYYDPAIGRFTTRDSYAGDPTQPQSLNRYSYVQDNPATYTDPSGMVDTGLLAKGVVKTVAGFGTAVGAPTLAAAVTVGSGGTGAGALYLGGIVAAGGMVTAASGMADIATATGAGQRNDTPDDLAAIVASHYTSNKDTLSKVELISYLAQAGIPSNYLNGLSKGANIASNGYSLYDIYGQASSRFQLGTGSQDTTSSSHVLH